MSKKNSALALMAILSVCMTATLVAAGNPRSAKEAAAPKKTRKDVNGIIAQQKAKLEADSKVFEESKTYPFFSRYQSPGLRTVKDVELRTVLKGSYSGEKPGETIEDRKDEFYHFKALRSASRIGIPFDFDFNMTVGFRVVLAPEMDVPIPEVADKEQEQ